MLRTSIIRKLGIVLTGAIAATMLAGAVGVGSAAAAATYSSRGFACRSQYRDVQINFPAMTSVSGNPEKVYFRATIWYWTSNGWAKSEQMPWYQAVANAYGTIAMNRYNYATWANMNNQNDQRVSNYVIDVPAGAYTITEHYYWSNGSHIDRQAYPVDGSSGYYCRI